MTEQPFKRPRGRPRKDAPPPPPPPPRLRFDKPGKAQRRYLMCYYAGAGWSAKEIAKQVQGGERHRHIVTAFLSAHDIRLDQKTPGEKVRKVRNRRRVIEQVEHFAYQIEMAEDLPLLFGWLVEEAMKREDVLAAVRARATGAASS